MIEYADNASLGNWLTDLIRPGPAPADTQRIADAIAAIPGYARRLAEQCRNIANRRANVGTTPEVLSAISKARDGWQNLRRLNNIAMQAWATARQQGKVDGDPPTVEIDTAEEGLAGFGSFVAIAAGVALVIVAAWLIAPIALGAAVVIGIIGALTAAIGALSQLIDSWSAAQSTPAAPGGGTAPTVGAIVGTGLGLWGVLAAAGLFLVFSRRAK